MGTVYLIASGGSFLLETILQLCVVGTHSGESDALFAVLLAFVMAPLIFINFVSAIQVTRTKDFTGKGCGKAVCIGFHSVQIGLLWRSFKLWILYDENDWLDFLRMRLFHSGFQSLPFSVTLVYSMFVNESKSALNVVTVLFSMISASVAMVTFRTGSKVYESSESDTRATINRFRVGTFMLTLSTLLVLVARGEAIVLFIVAKAYWIVLPLALHFIVHLFIEVCNFSCSSEALLGKLINAIFISFVNIFDMIGQGYTGVKCSYVLYYSVMLIENLALSFYWMLTADNGNGDQNKLLVVLIVILCFVIGLILKFASCGCIFNIESDILSDAFNNPELKEEKLFQKNEQDNLNEGHNADACDHVLFERELPDDAIAHVNTVTLTVDSALHPVEVGRRSRPTTLSSSTSSSALTGSAQEYVNQGFLRSQGNLSVSSQHTPSSHTLSSRRRSHKNSGESQEVSFDSSNKSGSLGGKRENTNMDPILNRAKSVSPVNMKNSKEHLPDFKHNRIATVKPTIIISDTSKHDTLPKKNNKTQASTLEKASNLTLASSQSKYSRNTHTLTGSGKYYGYNGFEDPYREQRQLNKNPRSNYAHDHRHQGHPDHYHPRNYASHYRHYQNRHQDHARHGHHRNMDYSLDSSELYPSVTSDTSSVSTYNERRERRWRKDRARAQRANRRPKHLNPRDGYATDVSSSDYLSCNDYSMGDSGSWTSESSDSTSSDGAATWPPSQSANLLKSFNIPDKKSSTENIMHWLEAMEQEFSANDVSFSTLNDPSVPSDTDVSLSAMQTFEVKKEKKKFRKLMSKPKGLLLKFSSLNYKGKEKKFHERPYPLKTVRDPKSGDGSHDNLGESSKRFHDNGGFEGKSFDNKSTSVPLPVDNVQESIV